MSGGREPDPFERYFTIFGDHEPDPSERFIPVYLIVPYCVDKGAYCTGLAACMPGTRPDKAGRLRDGEGSPMSDDTAGLTYFYGRPYVSAQLGLKHVGV